jgi:hypothetical protein
LDTKAGEFLHLLKIAHTPTAILQDPASCSLEAIVLDPSPPRNTDSLQTPGRHPGNTSSLPSREWKQPIPGVQSYLKIDLPGSVLTAEETFKAMRVATSLPTQEPVTGVFN